jgi:hypothetical protein
MMRPNPCVKANHSVARFSQAGHAQLGFAEIEVSGGLRVMRCLTFFGLAILLGFTSGCVTRGPKVLPTGSETEIDAEALVVARADIAAGRPRVCYAGTIGVFPVGVPQGSLHLVRDLPRFPLPSGCTNPLAIPAFRFAQIYNTEVLRHLKQRKRD